MSHVTTHKTFHKHSKVLNVFHDQREAFDSVERACNEHGQRLSWSLSFERRN